MADTRMFKTAFWDDEYISWLEKLERYFFMYAITNPKTNISGIYQIKMKQIVVDTGFQKSEVEEMFQKFESDWKMIYKDGWLALKNFIKHQKTGSQLLEKGIRKYVDLAPQWCREYIRSWYPMHRVSTYESESESQSELEPESKSEDISVDIWQPPAVGVSGWDPEKEKGEENLEITQILDDIREELSLGDFKEDKKKQRLRGLHLVNLRTEIGEKEYMRRWKAITADAYKNERCNSLDFIYSEIKAFADPGIEKEKKAKKRAAAEVNMKKEEEDLKAATAKKRKELEDIYAAMSDADRETIEKEATANLEKMKITREAETKKGRESQFLNLLNGSILNIITKRQNEANIQLPQ